MKNDCRIIRVDPDRRTIATMQPKFGKNATPKLCSLARAKSMGSREILRVDAFMLVVAAGLEVDEAMKGWRLRGGEDTAGIGILFGRMAGDGIGMVDVPVTADWVRERIEWLDGEDVEDRSERAAEMIPSLNEDIRVAITGGLVLPPDGNIWLSAAHRDLVGGAMVTLGLGTERSRGQMLTKLGEAVHDFLMGEEA